MSAMFSFYEHSLDNVTVYRENYRRNYRRVWVFSDRRHTVSRCNLLEKSGEISRLITGDMQYHCLHRDICLTYVILKILKNMAPQTIQQRRYQASCYTIEVVGHLCRANTSDHMQWTKPTVSNDAKLTFFVSLKQGECRIPSRSTHAPCAAAGKIISTATTMDKPLWPHTMLCILL